jgi:hypothetical protein
MTAAGEKIAERHVALSVARVRFVQHAHLPAPVALNS